MTPLAASSLSRHCLLYFPLPVCHKMCSLHHPNNTAADTLATHSSCLWRCRRTRTTRHHLFLTPSLEGALHISMVLCEWLSAFAQRYDAKFVSKRDEWMHSNKCQSAANGSWRLMLYMRWVWMGLWEGEMWMVLIYCEPRQEGKSKSHIQLDYNNKHSIDVGHLAIYRNPQ